MIRPVVDTVDSNSWLTENAQKLTKNLNLHNVAATLRQQIDL
jgi:hypothetical protein